MSQPPPGALRPAATFRPLPFAPRGPLGRASSTARPVLFVAARDERAGVVRLTAIGGDAMAAEPRDQPLAHLSGMCPGPAGGALLAGSQVDRGSAAPALVATDDAGEPTGVSVAGLGGELDAWPVPFLSGDEPMAAWTERRGGCWLVIARIQDGMLVPVAEHELTGTTDALSAGAGAVLRSRVSPDGLDAVLVTGGRPHAVTLSGAQSLTAHVVGAGADRSAVWIDRGSGSVRAADLAGGEARLLAIPDVDPVRAIAATEGALLWRAGAPPPQGEGEREELALWSGGALGPATALGDAGPVLAVVGWAGRRLVAVHGVGAGGEPGWISAFEVG